MTEFWYKKKSKDKFRIAVTCTDDLEDELGVEQDVTGYYRRTISRSSAKRLLKWLRKEFSPLQVMKGELPPDLSERELPIHGNELYWRDDSLRVLRKHPYPQIDLREALPHCSPNLTVREAQEAMLPGMQTPEGVLCLGCGQLAKEYERPLHYSMAAALKLVVDEFRRGTPSKHRDGKWLHIERFFKDVPGAASTFRGDFAKLRFWGLVKQRPKDASGKKHAGYWRPTRKGERFVDGETRVIYAYRDFNKYRLGFVGPRISFRKALKNKFDLDKLMRGIVKKI
jgi:hypothetical protein